MVPSFDPNGNLPPGIHQISWKELSDVFGTTRHREQLLKGLLEAAKALKSVGCKKLYVDGSFITDTDVPKDFDGCWESVGVDLSSTPTDSQHPSKSLGTSVSVIKLPSTYSFLHPTDFKALAASNKPFRSCSRCRVVPKTSESSFQEIW